jgi:hypothetical protein
MISSGIIYLRKLITMLRWERRGPAEGLGLDATLISLDFLF